jgi:hypothetical protein
MVGHERDAIRGFGAIPDLPECAFVYRRTPNWDAVD